MARCLTRTVFARHLTEPDKTPGPENRRKVNYRGEREKTIAAQNTMRALYK